MKKLTILILISITAISCNFNGFKPAPDAVGGWHLHKWAETADVRDSLYKFVVKRDEDFRECNIDPVGGSFVKFNYNTNSEAEGYLCIESKGWYNNRGATCLVEWLYFDEPECIAWRQERGLINAPRPKKYTY